MRDQRVEFANQLPLQDASHLTHTLHLCYLILVDLSSNRLKEFFLLPPLILSLLLDDFHKFAALGRVGTDDLELCSFFFSEGFGGDGCVLGGLGDPLEDLHLEIFAVLDVKELDLPLKEGHITLVVLQRLENPVVGTGSILVILER